MMLEYALEKFPISMKLHDGTECVVRPLGKRDETRLHKFFLVVPEEERLFIKQPVFDREMFKEWCRHADFERNLDRKSTRLNSSHLGISYAVFCLKKTHR